ncbi:MAG: hypothetical protein A2W98_05995 [Bacteroidetes bacterium GWF2_33_38]|nr:MAG: hypothetical protein A2W98_05995 [Bacteroidetes bacterium GWF2_33_38]OFY74230.1 MAG: hypothetical protein A2265_00690 [Bacteroidetes bacterium RIFOXYA12_FULL_33_9]OFY90569.1 MAG: hypothetical protein A2236_05605 [Bacteroidetes bacterium RIFOXYA2_FULL_33_7]HBX49589.1 hypothetical protein [Bacteroidales bacterium]
MIKRYIFGILIILAFGQVYSQKIIKSKFIDAEYYFLFDEYSKALPLYLSLIDKDPSNANINYRISLCYMNMVGQKYKAIPYLENAVKNVSETYNEGSYKELQAPFEAYLYLGDAYRINEDLDKAIEAYSTFKSLLNPREIYFLDIVERQIESCQYAKELFFEPVMVEEIPMGDIINTPFYEYNPVLNAKGDMIIFQQSKSKESIFISKFVDGVWEKPKNITSAVKSDGFCKVVSISPDEKSIFLTDDNLDNEGDLYVSQLKKSKPYPMEKLNRKINSKYSETHACLSPDGKTLYFTSDRKGGFGGLDIYKSNLNDKGDWEEPINLGSTVNSKYSEDTPFMLEDGKTMYFSSEGHNSMGGFDFFVTTLLDDQTWSVPMNLGYPINTTDDDLFYSPARNGEFAYCARIKNFGDAQSDIYKITPSQTNIPKEFTLSGNVMFADGRIDNMSKVNISVSNSSNQEKLATIKPDSLGDFSQVLPVVDCKIIAEVEGYNKVIENIVIPRVITKLEFKYNLEFTPILLATTEVVSKKDSITIQNSDTAIVASNKTIEANIDTTSQIIAENYTDSIHQETTNLIAENTEQIVTENNNATTVNGQNNQLVSEKKDSLIAENTVNNQHNVTNTETNNNNVVATNNTENSAQIKTTENTNNSQSNNTQNIVANNNANTNQVATNNSNSVANKDIYVAKSIFFDFASYSLNNNSKTDIERLYNTLKANPELTVEISGHTDSKGNPEYNRILSEQRAKAVLTYLSSKGIAKGRIIIKALGEEQHIAINENPDGSDNPNGRQLNRRVDVNLIGSPNQNIVVENVAVPDNLKFSQDTKFYILLGEVKEKYNNDYFSKYNINELKNAKTYTTSNGFAYIAGEFSKKPDALKLLNNSIDAGFEEAKIINSFELNTLIADAKTKAPEQNTLANFESKSVNSYTVQISAIRSKADHNKFAGITELQEVYCNDGYYRYVVGEYSDYITARSKRNELAQMGYPDAFVIKTALLSSKVENKTNASIESKKDSAPNTNSSSGDIFTIQIKAMNTPIGVDNFSNLENVVERKCSNGSVKYTVGEYPNIQVATFDLDKIKQAGYHDAFIVNVNTFNQVNNTTSAPSSENKNAINSNKYTVQIKASKERIKIKEFDKYKNEVIEFIGQDGYYRYAVGEYSLYSEAKEAWMNILIDYEDAFITKIDSYQNK